MNGNGESSEWQRGAEDTQPCGLQRSSEPDDCSSSQRGVLRLGHGLSVSPKVCTEEVCFPTMEGVESFNRWVVVRGAYS